MNLYNRSQIDAHWTDWYAVRGRAEAYFDLVCENAQAALSTGKSQWQPM